MIKPIVDRPHLRNCDFSVITHLPASFADVLAYYDRFRSYIQHEDDLINSRLTWSLTVHGFLFAIYGLLVGKIADLFVELHKFPTVPLPVQSAITILLLLQIPIAIFGAFVGYQSSQAIIASHNAIQHLFSIAHGHGPLEIAPPLALGAPAPLHCGPQTVTPPSMEGIVDGSHLLIYHHKEDSKEEEEVVLARNITAQTFQADFRHHHSSGTVLRNLGAGLLPKIISGGDQGAHTGGAKSYYLTLPVYAERAWIALFLISGALAVSSMVHHRWLFSFMDRISN